MGEKDMKLATRTFLYHITPRRWRHSVILKPRHCGISGEPKFARICTCPSPAQCLIAINFRGGGDINYYIYRTQQPLRGCYTWQVQDAVITAERWLLKPTKFIRVATLRKGTIARFDDHWDSWDGSSTKGLIYYYDALRGIKWLSNADKRRALNVPPRVRHRSVA